MKIILYQSKIFKKKISRYLMNPVDYSYKNKNFRGYLALPKKPKDKTPAIVIAHAWMGLDEFAKNKAKELSELGYIAFVADLYGDGIVVDNDEAASKLMLPLFQNRSELQGRISAAYDTLKKVQGVDSNKIGGIGFCFGGLTIIELLRSGAPVKGVVSFHGVLGNKMGNHPAQTVPIANNIKGSLLILHGHDDPLVSQEDILSIQKEMTKAKVDWQMNIYGHTAHAFTNPEAHNVSHGLIYQPQTKERTWLAMKQFFDEVFNK